MERNIVVGWKEKNAGGRDVQALQSAQSVVNGYTSMPRSAQTCLNGDRKMHLFALVSNANALIAMLSQSSASIKNRNLPVAHHIVAAASQYRNANSISWRAINADAAKVQRRYAGVAHAEAAAAVAKRQSACARPYVAATIIHAVDPDTPPLAQQQGISGIVQIVVSLNTDSKVVGTRVQDSPSVILNRAALAAARESTYQTELRDCKPVAADYVFSVDFPSQ